MNWWHKVLHRFVALFRKEELDAEMEQEMRSHIEMQTQENIEAGMEPEDAGRAAAVEFGSAESIKEECREQRGVSWMESLGRDMRYGARGLWKNPGFTTAAVLTIALGMGANVGVFSVVNAVLLRPLPYSEAARLVAVCESNPRQGLDDYVTSMGAYADWRRQNLVFQQLAAATVLGSSPVIGKSGAELVHVAAVSAEFFPLLGIQPILGRQFTSEEENPDRGDAVLMSEALWRERFGADAGVLDQSIQLGDRSFRVVGVMPATVKLFDPAGVQGWDNGFSKSDLWRPLPVASGLQKQRNYRAFLVLGRLKPNVSIARAQADMAQLAAREAQDYPDSNAGWTIKVRSWHSMVVRNVRLPLMLLWAAVGLVLLIAIANLANLSIARAVSRQKEFGIRLALGAGRFRLARQLLAESLLLSGLGGTIGLLFARWSTSLLSGLIPESVPRADEIGLDARVLGFTLVSSLVVGLLFGLAPLLTVSRRDMNGSLKPGTRGSIGSRGSRQLRGLLVISEVALAVVLVMGAGLLIRSFHYLNDVNPGFQPDNVVAVDLSIGGPGYTNEFRRIQFVQQLLTRLSELPGVESSAAVDGLPLDTGRGTMDIALTSIGGSPPATPDGKLVAGLRLASPEYFQTMGISFTWGRSFTGRDNTNAPQVVIINEALARRCFAGRSPIGQTIGSPDFGSQPCEIVGVIKDLKQSSMDAAPKPEVFRPLLQECFSSITIVARGASAPNQTLAALRSATLALDRSSPAYNPRTLHQLVSKSLALRRFALLLMTLFAGLALSLAVVGIYGVLSWAASERVPEIGIRLALGAQRRQVLRMILTQGMRSVAIGGLIGIAGVWPLTRFLRNLLYAVSPTDPFTLIAVALLLFIVALAACWLPARRAAKTDPIVALRHE